MGRSIAGEKVSGAKSKWSCSCFGGGGSGRKMSGDELEPQEGTQRRQGETLSLSPAREPESTTTATEAKYQVEDGFEEDAGGEILMEGLLWKRSMYVKRWKRRHFELRPGVLRYKADAKDAKYRGTIPRDTWQSVGLLPPLKRHPDWTGFYLHTSEDSLALATETLEEAQHWVSCLVAESGVSGGEATVVVPPLDSGGQGEGEEGEPMSPLTDAEESALADERKAKEGRRPSFSFSPSIFASRVRSQSLFESQEGAQAEQEEQFSLVSGMMADILKKKDARIQELAQEADEARAEKEAAEGRLAMAADDQEKLEASLRVVQSQNEELQNANDDLCERLRRAEEAQRESSGELEEENEDLRGKLGAASSERAELEERMQLIVKDLEERTRLHGELQIEHLKLQDKLEEMQAISNAVLRPFWSPKAKSPKKTKSPGKTPKSAKK